MPGMLEAGYAALEVRGQSGRVQLGSRNQHNRSRYLLAEPRPDG